MAHTAPLMAGTISYNPLHVGWEIKTGRYYDIKASAGKVCQGLFFRWAIFW
jgi:hypothetical protein